MAHKRRNGRSLPALSYDRERLRQMLIERAIVRSSDRAPLLDRQGRRIPWIYYGGELSLAPDGLELMTLAILDRLQGFSATQIATYGQSAVPILSACIARSQGRYSGLVIRKERKDYGLKRQIDGPIDRSRPVVVIDESISSGSSASHAIDVLEREGLQVEGVFCIVEFRGYGAAEWLRACGYRVETIFDVWSDLGQACAPRSSPPALPDQASGVLPTKLTPAEVARRVAESYIETGLTPRPPQAFDRDHDGSGGVFISIRRRSDDFRIARAGLWFHELESVDTRTAVVLSTIKALAEAPDIDLADLQSLKFAVSMIGRPEPIGIGAIDNEKHALMIKGRGPLERIGFALPNSPQHDDALQQYLYARSVSASFSNFEPCDLYRQRIQRSVEPEDRWPSDGAPKPASDWTSDPAFVATLQDRVCELLDESWKPRSPTSLPSPPERIFGVGVTLYRRGIAGCSISTADNLDAALSEAFAAALADQRYAANRNDSAKSSFVAVVSILIRRRWLGRVSPDRMRLFFRLGRDTLQAAANGRSGFVLAHFPVHQSVSPEQFQNQVLTKAGVDAASAEWTAFETIGFAIGPQFAVPLELGFPKRAGASATKNDWFELARRIAEFILAQRSENGLPAYLANPWDGSRTNAGTATRVLLAVNGLLELSKVAGGLFQAEAEVMLELMIEQRETRAGDLQWDCGSDAQLLQCLALASGREKHFALAERLVSGLKLLVRADGAIHVGDSRIAADLDLLSGSALLALASSDWVEGSLEGLELGQILAFYRRRFKLIQPWSMVWWHARAWNRLAERSPNHERFADELVDWAIERQNETAGAFMIHSLEPHRFSFLSACILEAVADVWDRCARTGDPQRADRLAAAWNKGMKFVERLVLSERDCYFIPDPKSFAGGVRATLASSTLRIDYAGHALMALAKGLAAASLVPPAAAQKKAGSSVLSSIVASAPELAIPVGSATDRLR